MERNHRRFMIALASLVLLVVGCAADPATQVAARAGVPNRGGRMSPLYATVDEAAVAGLVAARANATPVSRYAIQIGGIRRAGGGYVWTAPVVASASVLDRRPAVARFALTHDDVASFIVHPQSGTKRVDRMNERLNASERRLLEDRRGRARPVYLLTPRLEVVRHAQDEPELCVANLRTLRRAMSEGTRTAMLD